MESRNKAVIFRLEDYRPPDYLIPQTRLAFRLSPDRTLVAAELAIARRAGISPDTPLVLQGDGLRLTGLALDGDALSPDRYEVSPDRLVVRDLPDTFTLRIETELDPSTNKTLSGLYRSGGNYCTQCEAEGFRRITYFLDRPDVLSLYTVRIEAPLREAPLLLSNGNPAGAGTLPDGWHYAEWHDPFPKPSYLFALVAGNLGSLRDRFLTRSGRNVDLAIHVEKGKESRARYAMDALKRSMRWDETEYGREYDLDVFNIVAVPDFNMGAMENKGLNIFNDKYVLADPETATDTDYANIEAIIAHEYFHNWTGNRITCRDWFQLCLKEGLTVFRDHEFSADQRSRPVKRIAEIRTLKARQFPEDAGPLAHPVRPHQYREINNFYTPTVYEKGSEVVRMIRTLIGADDFRRGMDLYFERHDGQAVTIEDFLAVFAEVSGRALDQFSLWYHQAGTPHLSITTAHDAAAGQFIVEIEQSVPPTPGESVKQPMHIPLAFGLVGPDGDDLEAESATGAEIANGIIHVVEDRHCVVFSGIRERPVLSINRGFSAPVTISHAQSQAEQIFLARHDRDPVGRWLVLTELLTSSLVAAARRIRSGGSASFQPELISLLGEIAADARLDPAYRALALTLPAENDIALETGQNIDPDAIHAAREALVLGVGAAHESAMAALLREFSGNRGEFSPDAASAGRRALCSILADYLSAASGKPDLAARLYSEAGNMTELMSALSILVHRFGNADAARLALADFESRFGSDGTVLDKWFQVQATRPGAGTLSAVRKLTAHPAFDFANPNRLRALVGAFANLNPTGFHRPDGEAYEFLADIALMVERFNPQMAAWLATAFRSWNRLEPGRQELARAALVRIRAETAGSADLTDIVDRTLA